MKFEKNYYSQSPEEVLEIFDSREKGLSEQEAKKRLEIYGSNELSEAKKQNLFLIFLRQFKSPLIYVLLLAGLIVALTGEIGDAVVVFFVLVFNSVVGTVQEGRAQNVFFALKKFIRSRALVFREGKEMIVDGEKIVPGDIIYLREGEKVPADARIIYSGSLKIDESALSGESIPKFKTTEPIRKKNLPVMSQDNMAFKGTSVAAGSGKAVVVATGSETYLGKIAEETLSIDTDFPLKKDLAKISRWVIYFVLAVGITIFFLGLNKEHSLLDIFKTIVAISVSVIPEGLPIVVTLVLAGGVSRMAQKNVLVKKLQAVEVLGETKILAVDKTGTVTRNELLVKKVFSGGKIFEIGGFGYAPEGEIFFEGKKIAPANHPEILLLAKIASLVSDSNLIFRKKEKKWKISGDPTDGALAAFSQKAGFEKEVLLGEWPLIWELPFDYHLKYRASLFGKENKYFLAVSGSPESVIELSQKELGEESILPLSPRRKKELSEIQKKLSTEGFRVISLAYRDGKENSSKSREVEDLVFAGFLGIQDDLKPEVPEAVEKVKSSGVKLVMITGDYKITAQSLAEKAGIFRQGDEILNGEEIEKMKEGELEKKIEKVSVFSRVTPEHKLKIIEAYRRRGLVVAMTGDGVNDTLSLSAADIGIGMGKIGTDVAKESSDIILLDDNFGNIVHGIEEGRRIFETIKKVVLYLFSTSLGEVFTIIGALFVGFPLPILAVQILWLNLVTDGFLDVTLAMDRETDSKKEESGKKNLILDPQMIKRMFYMAIPMSLGTLALFAYYLENDPLKALTVSLTTLAVFQWFNAWNCRSEKRSIFSQNPFSNKYLVLATLTVIILQLLAIYNPLLSSLLRTVPLALSDWLLIIPTAFSIVIFEEARKFFRRR